MPGLAAAGFKPAVYTNFTTLANSRIILEDRAALEALVVARTIMNTRSILVANGRRVQIVRRPFALVQTDGADTQSPGVHLPAHMGLLACDQGIRGS